MKHPIESFLIVSVGLLLAACTTVPDGDQATGKRGSATQPSAPASSPAPVAVQPAATPEPVVAAPVDVPAPAREPSASEKKLAAALGSYERGEYGLAIRSLTPLTTDSSLDPENQLVALKTLAFSQCLTRAITACRKTFERAFALDGKFDLAPAEKGHPIWGPQFVAARKAAAPKTR